jgi:signal peptidase I
LDGPDTDTAPAPDVSHDKNILTTGEYEPASSIPPSKGSKLRGLAFDILVYGFALLLILGSTMFAFSNSTEKSIFGYRFYHVLTPSMEPVFGVGDMIFVKLCEPEDVKKDDIITFVPNRNAKAYLTHRAVEIRPGENGGAPVIVTRGDANNTEDPPISGEAVVGKYVFHIPKVGSALQFVRENIILMGICLAASFALLIFLRSYFSAKRREAEGAVDESPREEESPSEP